MFDNLERLVYDAIITATGETTIFDVIYNTDIDFGNIKGGIVHQRLFNLFNKGNNDIFFQ